MAVIHGFELIREQEIRELNSQARFYRHVRTGAELLSVANDDENKCFGVTFKTPPPDSTGLPHILEHSVLGGSRKYPVKEPFMELIKGSLNTFLNAMTFPDLTTYPVASQNLRDFYNLVDVYLDSVFYPTITKTTLQQEGWHFELEEENAPLTYGGIVFNEMKGYYSSPDNLIGRHIEKNVLPDTIYANDSGGDPAVIPDLTYENFIQFHQKYYHPSNARFFFYGDDDPNERLRLVDAFIADFNKQDVDGDIALQEPFSEPRLVTAVYDAGEDEEAENRSMVSVSWLLPEVTEHELGLAFQILAEILINTPASPLRKALIDSGLGEDLIGGGVSPYQRQMYFSTGLKGVAKQDTQKVEALILETLSKLAEEGIERDMVEAALNTIEFRLRENNTGRFPRGLAIMIGVLPGWIHGGNPIDRLAFESALENIKKQAAAENTYFENLIGRYFINNAHRSTVILEPESGVNQQLEEAEVERLSQIRAGMSSVELEQVKAAAAELERIQDTPDSPEALATIPMLTLADLEREIKVLPIDISSEHGSKLLYHDISTNGVVYLDLGLDLHTLPSQYLAYVQLFGQALLEMGTETEDFVKLSQRIGRKTGGIDTAPFTSLVKGTKHATSWLFLRGKTMASQTADLLAILRDILLTVKLDNPARFRQIVLEAKADAETGLIPGGHRVARTRLEAHLNEADWADEQMFGVSYLFFLRDLIEKIDQDWPAVLKDLEAVRSILINRSAMLFNVTLDAENWSQFRPQLRQFIAELPAGNASRVEWSPALEAANEGLVIPAQVNYVAKGGCLYDHGYTLHGSGAVISNYLSNSWLHENIRAKGGAYGGFCTFDHVSGNFAYLSYRDPNLLQTVDVYDASANFLKELELSEAEITKAIIGTIGDMDAHLLPDAKGFTSMVHHLIGYTNEMRQQMRDEVLSTKSADFKAFGDALAALDKEGSVVVVGSKDAIERANAERGDWLKITKVL